MRKLLCVEEAFKVDGRGLILAPDLPWGPPAKAEAAEIRQPDGRVAQVRLLVLQEHRGLALDAPAGAKSWARVCVLKGVAKSDVPVGSELWCDDALVAAVMGETLQ